jgi:hypothetical protein
VAAAAAGVSGARSDPTTAAIAAIITNRRFVPVNGALPRDLVVQRRDAIVAVFTSKKKGIRRSADWVQAS